MDGTEQISAMSEQVEVDLEIPTGIDEPLAGATDDAVEEGEGKLRSCFSGRFSVVVVFLLFVVFCA